MKIIKEDFLPNYFMNDAEKSGNENYLKLAKLYQAIYEDIIIKPTLENMNLHKALDSLLDFFRLDFVQDEFEYVYEDKLHPTYLSVKGEKND